MILAPVFCRDFVGRGDEVRFIMGCFDECRQGRETFALIGGDAGVGKSRLLAEARRRLQETGAQFLSGQCHEHAPAPLAPFVELLRVSGLVDSGLMRSSPDLRVGLRRLPLESDGAPADDHQAPIAGDAREQFAAIREAFCRIAEASPVVAVIEDAHWADLATLDCLQFLTERTGPARVLIVVTYRSDELHRRHSLRLLYTSDAAFDSLALEMWCPLVTS